MSRKHTMYGVFWPDTILPIEREFECIRRGGRWKKRAGGWAGLGVFYHWKKAIEILWPDTKWHKWNELETRCFLKYRFIAEMGCAAAGKSHTAATNVLLSWYIWPSYTTVLVSSTDIESLEMRVWGIIKNQHKSAKDLFPMLPGHLIESRRRIVYDPKTESAEGRDFRNGLVGVPTKRGQTFTGLGSLIGIHNTRVIVLADELSLMPRALLDSVSNLSKAPSFKLIGLGNPKDTTDALGVLAEPAAHLGGWEGQIDQRPGTKTWETKFPKGVCIQLPASDTPNNAAQPGQPPPFPFLVTPQQVKEDIEIWGKDSLHFTMMSEGKMPRGQSARRIITRQACLKFHALEEPVWKSQDRTKIGFLDAAYRGTGGDRCVFGELQFGPQVDPSTAPVTQALLNQNRPSDSPKIVMALIDMVIVPVSVAISTDIPEDQIARFVRAECERRGIPPENFFFDSTGRGSLMGAFARTWSALVNGVEFGGVASERKVSNEIDVICKDYYYNMVTELWYSIRLVIEAQQMRNLNEEVIRELSMREWKYVSRNKIQVETKEEMKLKSGRSPDLADALAVGVEGARQRGFVIAKLTSPAGKKLEARWKRQVMDRAKASWQARELDYAA